MSISTASTMQLLLRREFWEHRAFVFAPAVVAGIMVLVAIFAPNELHVVGTPDAEWLARRNDIVFGVLAGLAVPFGIVMGIVTTFYLLDSLYADRKDRSILFWKSLPLSDTATVLSKLVMAAVVVPALTVAAVLATNLLVAFILSVRLSGFEQLHIWSTVWQPGVWLNAHGQVLYTLVLSTLWYLPIYAWFLLCSAWAGRSVILWASLPPIFGVILEHFMFGTEYVAGLLADRFIGWSRYTHLAQNPSPTDSDVVTWSKEFSGVVDLTAFLTSPGLWGGLIVAALFIWATIMLRRHKAAG